MHHYRKFIILSSPRSGTHMLRTSLDSHPNITCLTEMFNPDYTVEDYPFTPDTPEQEILDRFIFTDYPGDTQAVGFCIHRVGARFGNWPRLWDMLRGDHSIYVISLRRSNLLRRYLSFQLRQNQDLVNNPPEPMEFDPDKLITDFQRQLCKIEQFDQSFSEHPLTSLSYEELCGCYASVLRQLQEFLGVSALDLEPGTKKRATPALSNAVTNYAELKARFAGSEWAVFFDE